VRLCRFPDGAGDADERKTLVEGVEACDNFEVGHELVDIQGSGAVNAPYVEKVLLGIFEEI
jgi:hypothetical protein